MSPQSSFRSFVGVAKDSTNANLQIAHAAGATTLTLRTIVNGGATSIVVAGATFSAVIVDGVLGETVACTGNATGITDGSTIACGALTNAHSANAYVYFQVTASIGPSAYLSVTKIDQADAYVQLYDKGYRGSQADIYGAQQGTRVGNLGLDGDLFPDTFGYLMSSLCGAYDYTATSGINPTSYAFSPLNTGNGQPSPYLFYIYEPGAGNTRVYAKAVVSDLNIKFAPGALVGYTSTVKAFASTVVANPVTIPPAFSTFTPLPSRVGSVTIGGTISAKVESADYSFKRQAFGEIFTLQGIQDPLAIFGGPLAVSVKATAIADDDVELLRYINQTQPSFTINARIGGGAAATDNGIQIQTSKANYEAVKIMNTGKAWVVVDLPFQAIANAVDSTTAGGGLSPAKTTIYTKATGTATLY